MRVVESARLYQRRWVLPWGLSQPPCRPVGQAMGCGFSMGVAPSHFGLPS